MYKLGRIAIATEGGSNRTRGKLASALLRFRPEAVVAVLDSEAAGRRCQELFGVGGDTPVVGTLDGLIVHTLVLGVSPPGGAISAALRLAVRAALSAGIDVINTLHEHLDTDDELVALASKSSAKIIEIRKPPAILTLFSNTVPRSQVYRVHTVGTDAAVGKKVTALVLARTLAQRGLSTKFIATGQGGVLVEGDGIVVDTIPSDFVSGMVEQEVLRHQHNDIVVIEGQGSLANPAYSAVTLGLLHGCAPNAMIMCTDATHSTVGTFGYPAPTLHKLIAAFESMAGLLCPSRVVGVSINTSQLTDQAAARVMGEIEAEHGLPVVDVIRTGPDRLADALLAHRSLS